MVLPFYLRRIERFSEKYLSPSERLSEILFGLIMVLTITSTMKIVLGEGEEDIRTMTFAAIGCNLAWGIVDGAMYILTSLLEKGRYARLASSNRSAGKGYISLIKEEMEGTLIGTLNESEQERIYKEIAKSITDIRSEKKGLEKEDILGAFACFLLVFVSAFPVVIPFFIYNNLQRAVRISNIIAIGMLFAIGYEYGKYAGRNKLLTGIAMVLLGLMIVGVCIALGG